MLRTARCQEMREPHGLQRAVHELDGLGLDGLVVIAGNGGLRGAWELAQRARTPIVGVPKTIDNDLSATAFTFGFDSAVECATSALDRLHTTAASHERMNPA